MKEILDYCEKKYAEAWFKAQDAAYGNPYNPTEERRQLDIHDAYLDVYNKLKTYHDIWMKEMPANPTRLGDK